MKRIGTAVLAGAALALATCALFIGQPAHREENQAFPTVHADGNCEHEFIVSGAEAPTCVKDGNTGTQVCIKCRFSIHSTLITALGHNYAESIKEPTCTENGFVGKICERCGDEEVAETLPALGHDYTVTERLAPSCGREGREVSACTVCGDVTTVILPKTAHAFTERETPPTCTENGLYEQICSACGFLAKSETISALGHSTQEYAVSPTCTERGYSLMKCIRCDYEVKLNETEPLGHDEAETARKDPDCTENGYVTVTCLRCGEKRNTVLQKLGHDMTLSHKEPTCTENGYTAQQCARCGEMQTTALPAEGHAFRTDTVAPTCTQDGYTVKTCLNCGYEEYTDEIRSAGHVWSEWADAEPPLCEQPRVLTRTCYVCSAKDSMQTAGNEHEWTAWERVREADCTNTGEDVRRCAVCSLSESRTEDALGHDFRDLEIKPTCTEDGYLSKVCSRCDAEDYRERIPALGHSEAWKDEVPADCTRAGYTAYAYCERCGEHLTEKEIIPPLGHNGKWTVAISPTCTQEGTLSFLCFRCGYSESKQKEANGHEWGNEIYRAPSCTVEGERAHICLVCGEREIETVPPNGHTPRETEEIPATCTADGKSAGTVCAVCGEAVSGLTVLPALGHDYGEWTVTLSPACTQTGVRERTCSRDERHIEAEQLPAEGHRFKQTAAVEATCEQDGSTAGEVCETCGLISVLPKPIPALGHSWDGWSVTLFPTYRADGEERRACAACGTEQSRAVEKLTGFGAQFILAVEALETEADEERFARAFDLYEKTEYRELVEEEYGRLVALYEEYRPKKSNSALTAALCVSGGVLLSAAAGFTVIRLRKRKKVHHKQ